MACQTLRVTSPVPATDAGVATDLATDRRWAAVELSSNLALTHALHESISMIARSSILSSIYFMVRHLARRVRVLHSVIAAALYSPTTQTPGNHYP